MVRMERSRRESMERQREAWRAGGSVGVSRAVGVATPGTQGLAGACPHPPAVDTR